MRRKRRKVQTKWRGRRQAFLGLAVLIGVGWMIWGWRFWAALGWIGKWILAPVLGIIVAGSVLQALEAVFRKPVRGALRGLNRYQFQSEPDLRDFLAAHLDQVEPGLKLFRDRDGRGGQEYNIPVGRIDILAIDKDGGFVVIELKLSYGPDNVAGQVQRYKNWVKISLAKGRPVRGIIIAQQIPQTVLYAIAGDPEVSAMEYEAWGDDRPVAITLRRVEVATA